MSILIIHNSRRARLCVRSRHNNIGDLKEIRGIDFSRYVLRPIETSNITLIRVGMILSMPSTIDENSDIKLADVLDWVDIMRTMLCYHWTIELLSALTLRTNSILY